MRKSGILIVIFILLVTLVGCSLGKTENSKILDTVKQNIDAFNKKDLNAYMETINAPNANEIRNSMKIAFDTYTVNVKLSNLKITKKTSEEAVVTCIETIKQISGHGFNDGKQNATFYLKKVNGEWKITKTQTDNNEYSR